MKRLVTLCLLLLTACKREGTAQSAEAEALDYVRLVSVAASNAYTETGQPLPATPCTDPLFGMKKTTKFLKLERCVVRYDSDQSYTVAALFNKDLAVLSDVNGARRVNVDELPEVN
ncbi:hypothetical protein [Deinococcus sp.]|uniref:hypothetical protein n=1 Tax=Deinococcus sp. TaxID=47478 RepID=UPI0025C6E860|nr:hypothetical protein [Deinococcus sp.]